MARSCTARKRGSSSNHARGKLYRWLLADCERPEAFYDLYDTPDISLNWTELVTKPIAPIARQVEEK